MKSMVPKNGDSLVVTCPNGKLMEKRDSSPYGKGMFRVICDVCETAVPKKTPFMHCSRKHCLKHVNGYDLCLSCAEARRQTQDRNVPNCECGQTMNAIMSFAAYSSAVDLSCNVCSASINGVVWHCPKKFCDAHARGFDLCLDCGKTQAAKKSGIMGWLASAYPAAR